MTRVVDVELDSGGYPVYLGRDLLSDPGIWERHLSDGRTLVVSNSVVAPLYLDSLGSGLARRDFDILILPDGESTKTIGSWYAIIDKLVETQARRDASIIALGGGVVGDLSGFAAACYMRGIRFLQAPTTLLAQVDASVGGKTGVNHDKGKNLIGAFHQPAAVVIDSATLSSLAPREFNAGLAEVVKYGAIRDEPLFEWLEANVESIMERDAGALEHLIHRSVVNKAEIVSQDEREAGIRAILNFGHTFGHAIESETAYSGYLHGEAVAMGMVTAAHLSEVRGLCPAGTARRVSSLLQRFELPVRTPAELPVDGLCRALDLDKKAVASGLRLVLLEGIGHARLDSGSPAEDIRSAIAWSQGPEAEEKQE